MTFRVLKYVAIGCLGAIFLVWVSLRDTISCVVDNASVHEINGYYSVHGRFYVKRGSGEDVINPDLFDVYNMVRLPNEKNGAVITPDKSGWGIYSLSSPGNKVYGNSRVLDEESIHPPVSGWVKSGGGLSDGIVVHKCRGSLVDSAPALPPSKQSNVQIMLHRPVTTVLCASLLVIAYLLWSWRTEVSSVSFSYEAVVLRGEYWRAFTASFAHFDFMHIGFNVMSLYQLGEMEIVYGSAAYAYLSVDLVVITMVLCSGMSHLLIHWYHRHDLSTQQAVGYSCVLFAWMVAAAVRMDKYCPLFFMPSLCFDTYRLPLPGIERGLPVNLGPFVLLLITKLILPRVRVSSLCIYVYVSNTSAVFPHRPSCWNRRGLPSGLEPSALDEATRPPCRPDLTIRDGSKALGVAVPGLRPPPHCLGATGICVW